MKLKTDKPIEVLRANRRFECEELRALRQENTQRSVICYGLFALFTVNSLFVLLLVFLVGLHVVALSDKVVLTLIAETIANGAGMFYLVTKRLFSKN